MTHSHQDLRKIMRQKMKKRPQQVNEKKDKNEKRSSRREKVIKVFFSSSPSYSFHDRVCDRPFDTSRYLRLIHAVLPLTRECTKHSEELSPLAQQHASEEEEEEKEK